MGITESSSSSSMVSKKVIAIGIDLGNTYSRVGYWTGEELKIIGIPSCIAFTDYTEQPMIGLEAIDRVDKNPINTILDVKRLIGVRFSSTVTQTDVVNWSFEVIADPVRKNDDEPNVIIHSFNSLKRFSAEELLSMILKELKQIAEKSLGLENGDVSINAVISVPSCFNNAQRLATKKAATTAGFGDSRLINDTSAAALAYGWIKKKKSRESQHQHQQEQKQEQKHCVETRIAQEDEENVLIFDLGGGTLSVAVVNIKDGWNKYEVKSVAGNTHLGGKDFNDALSFHCSNEFEGIQNDEGICISARSKSRLMFACEESKITLCDPNVAQTTVNVDSYHCPSLNYTLRKRYIPLSVLVTQQVFNETFKELFEECEEEIFQCLRDSRIDTFHEVILVGGSTNIPRIRETLRLLCSDEKGLCEIMKPDIAVVQGAAIQAAILSGEALSNPLLNSISIADVAPLSLSASGPSFTLPNLIPRNTMIPTERRHRLTDLNIPVRDVETNLPVKKRNIQRRFFVGVREGEDATMKNNNLIGYFIFDGIQPDDFALSFAVDHDGILTVSTAAEDGSHRRTARQVTNTTALRAELNKSGTDMENPEQEAEEESRRKKLEAKTNLSLFVTQYMSRLVPDDFAAGFNPSQALRLEQAVTHAERWLEYNQLPEVRASELKLEQLQREYFQILHERAPIPKNKNI